MVNLSFHPRQFLNDYIADIISRGALIHELAPKEKRGQFFGLTVFVKILAQIPGVIIGGLLAQFLQGGYQFTFIIGGVIVLFSLPFISFTKLRTPLIQETMENRSQIRIIIS